MAPAAKKIKWTKEEKTNFTDLLLQERRQRRIGGSAIRKCDWVRLAEALNEKCKGRTFTHSQLQGKYNRMKDKYKKFKKCKDTSGFGWNAAKGLITATDPVWDNHLQKHPEHKMYQTKGMVQFDDFHEIFSNTFATGEFSKSSTQVPLSPEDLESIQTEYVQTGDEIPPYSSQAGGKKRRACPEYSNIETPSSKKGRDNELYNMMCVSIIKGVEAIASPQIGWWMLRRTLYDRPP